MSDATTNVVSGTPPKSTSVAPVNPEPLIATAVPIGPDGGLKPVMVGPAITEKLAADVPVPLGVWTVTNPEVAVAGTCAVIWVSELMTKDVSDTPLNFTAVAPVK